MQVRPRHIAIADTASTATAWGRRAAVLLLATCAALFGQPEVPAPAGTAHGATPQTRAAVPQERAGRCHATMSLRGIGRGCRTKGGLLRIGVRGGSSFTTHGVDGPAVAAGSVTPRAAEALEDAGPSDIACAPATEPRTTLIYSYPADGTNRAATIMPLLRQETYRVSAFLGSEFRSLDPTRTMRLRLRCDEAGIPVVLVERLPTAAASDSFSTVVADLNALGHGGVYSTDRTDRYLVFHDGVVASGAAGVGHLYVDDRASRLNHSNNGGLFAVEFAWSSVPHWRVLLHEIAHNMGAVQHSGPNATDLGHCNDGNDVMCYADGSPDSAYVTSACSSELFDCGRNDYFDPLPAAGSYLATHWNLASPHNRFGQISSFTATGDGAEPVMDDEVAEPVTDDGASGQRDTVAPTRPRFLRARTLGVSRVRLSWGAAHDDVGVVRYEVQRAAHGRWIRAGASRTRVRLVSGLRSATRHHFRIRAVDAAGNASRWIITSARTAAHLRPSGRVAPGEALRETDTDSSGPTLTDNQSGDDVWRTSNTGSYDIDFFDATELARFEVRVWAGPEESGTLLQDWTEVATLSGTSHTANWSLPSSTWSALPEGTSYVAVRAFDSLDHWSDLTDAFTVRKDTTGPDAVTTLRSPSPVEGARELTWSPVRDAASGTAYYRVFRSSTSGSLGSQINSDGSTTGASYTDAAALPDGTYHYTVRAVDHMGHANTSAANDQISVSIGEASSSGETLSISSPTHGSLVTETPTTVTGTASGALAASSLTLNGVAARVGADGSFRASIALSSSPATITAEATDANGMVTRTSVTVSFHATTFHGTGDDTLAGDGLPNVLIDGDRGTHIFCGAGGRDVVRAGGGDDVIDCVEPFRTARRDADTVDCGAGHDRALVDLFDSVTGCEVVVRVWTGTGVRNTFGGTRSTDWFIGTGGADTVTCGGGRDRVSSGGGDDVVRCSDPHGVASGSRDTVDCGTGTRDRAFVDVHDHTTGCEIVVHEVLGTEGLDRLRGSNHDEMIYGMRGDDRLTCGGGRDTAYGGIGDDTIDCADSRPSRSGRDVVECGVGRRDHAIVDRFDTVSGCELVTRR